jgi:TonB family protein
MVALRKRFHGRDDLCERAHAWVRAVNLDTLELLEEVVELSASGTGKMDAAGLRKVIALKERELRTRNQFVLEGLRIKTKLDGFRLPVPAISATSTPRSRLSRQVAAAVLAIGVQASLPIGGAMAQPAPVPLQQAGGNQEKCCSLSGIVTDPAAAVVQNATITITNLATRGVITLKTDDAGQFTAKDLPAGKYNVTAVLDGFKTTAVNGVEVTEGTAARVNIRLELGNWGGCCEYAAAPMRAPANYAFKTTPFIYGVGESDDRGTLKGIAKLVYGDQKRWIQIYEANRDKVINPNALSYGMALTIPGSRQPEPKLETKVLPTYPPEATRQHIHGEVAMDVTLNDDGTVRTLKVIEGNPLLDSAAADAVKQWKYRPPTAHDKRVDKFVVVLTFERNGKVR